jgi:IS605 OrfB family transposase
MQRTISLKIDLPAEFADYLATCAIIFNRYVAWSFDTKSYNKSKAHQELYSILRKEYPDVPSAIIQSIRDTALESVKALKFKFRPFKKPTSHVRYDKRTISLRGDQLSIGWSGDKRIKQIIKLPKFFKERYSDWKFQAATVGYDRPKKCFKANLIFDAPTPEALGDRSVGVDRGLYNIVSLSDGFRYASNGIRKVKREVLFLKKQLQTKGTRSAIRKLKKLSGYEKRFSLNENHKISKQLVSMPYDVFVLEDLKGILKQKSKGKVLNKWLSNWSFWQLEQLLVYKAEAIGKKIVKVDARYTSQKCSNCSQIEKKNRKRSRYECDRCGYREHADVNAANNIRNNLICAAVKPKAQQALVNVPNVATEKLAASHQPCAGGH